MAPMPPSKVSLSSTPHSRDESLHPFLVILNVFSLSHPCLKRGTARKCLDDIPCCAKALKHTRLSIDRDQQVLCLQDHQQKAYGRT